MHFSSRLKPDALAIFLVHGVIRRRRHAVRNYTAKHIPEEFFISFLRDLKESGNAMSMRDVVSHKQTGKPWPSHAFAITFDDGFANNFTVAAPILEDFHIPATFYVTTRFVNDNSASWIDQIEYALEKRTPCRFHLEETNSQHILTSAEEKINFLKLIRTIAKKNPEVDPYGLAAKIWKQTGIEKMDRDEGLDEKLTWPQIEEMDRNPLFTVGGHGHTHRILSFLEPDELKAEIDTSFSLLRPHLAQEIRHYSYPEGLSHCYSPAVISQLKGHGVQCCPSAMDGMNSKDEDLFHLKRITVEPS